LLSKAKKMNLGTPHELRIQPLALVSGKRQFVFRLRFHGRKQPVEFETSGDDAMSIMLALRELQAKYKLPIPQRPGTRGKPVLSIVRDDDE
jgi:hypothetical protein